MAGVVSMAGAGAAADPRLGGAADDIGTTRRASMADVAPPDAHGHNTMYLDPSITFEAYHFWANRSREVEKYISTDAGLKQLSKILVGKKVEKDPLPMMDTKQEGLSEKVAGDAVGTSGVLPESPSSEGHEDPPQFGVHESEWEQAQRALRTATWGSIFYLITTDILGPYNVPWAISNMGYGPGIALYVVFGGFAAYSGLQLWKMFVGLDSTRYPMRNYGDLAFRIFGAWARILVNVLQSFQFFLNVALCIESNGQGLAQMAAGANQTGFLCFVVAEVIFMVLGMLLGQIRTLQRLGFLANLAVWLNVIVIFMTMAVTSEYGPNELAANTAYGVTMGEPVRTSANWPVGSTLIDRTNGLMNGVFAYGGATLFNELMAEMRRPMDFWKGFVCAEIFIFAVYVTMGMVVYTFQGQYTFNPAYQGIPNSAYRFQTLGNAISFISGLIAALLYGNIGIKVFYAAICRDIFRAPPLDHKVGKWLWVGLVPIYWGLALVVAAAIPQVANLTSFVGAACILQFSYTFPPVLMVGFNAQKDAILPEEGFDPATGQSNRVDHGFKRFMRGYRKKFALNTFDSLYFIGALATAGLGIYASVIGMHDTFAATKITPFTCANPAG